MILNRRDILTLLGAGFAGWGRLSAGTSDFWNRKEPAEWSPEEIDKLMSKSPWAREVHAERSKKIREPGGVPNSPFPGGSRSRSGGMGKPPKNPSSQSITSYTGTVIWESAKPIRDALKTPLPEGFAGQYVLSVSGVPLAKSKTQDDDGSATASHGALEKLKAATTLRVKGKDPSQPAAVQQQTGNGAVYLFGFNRDGFPIAKEDKEVVFETHMGKLIFNAKFSPKDMLYHGELAV